MTEALLNSAVIHMSSWMPYSCRRDVTLSHNLEQCLFKWTHSCNICCVSWFSARLWQPELKTFACVGFPLRISYSQQWALSQPEDRNLVCKGQAAGFVFW
ncbi:hypothetical protein ElyMa_005566400 [Elysia marginata]|uniref:Uncharacterized protein n=1 Tax=Elysia marginata TaxID=1093978 RepID=A0AAV4F201_9GAST|nr:hypothetical protein ElyMa_005566400 [Elysia marginata]